ncbi:MAG: biopolymer transporter ExbD [Verrucomicrobia bacterium]|nr:biopolymer transporter ExbD [Verrucomicrobiota bacterium]MCH8510637.1 biopolymer transporter ExbD [Kiritimatiellia bacterium]
MGRKAELLQRKAFSDINLTPLMDLTFILLITFIITFPLLESGLNVDLPAAKGTPLTEENTIPVSVDLEGYWYVEQRQVTAEQFAAEMRNLRQTRPEATVLLRGDRGLPYGRLMEIMQAMHENGITRISLVTQTGQTLRPGS